KSSIRSRRQRGSKQNRSLKKCLKTLELYTIRLKEKRVCHSFREGKERVQIATIALTLENQSMTSSLQKHCAKVTSVCSRLFDSVINQPVSFMSCGTPFIS